MYTFSLVWKLALISLLDPLVNIELYGILNLFDVLLFCLSSFQDLAFIFKSHSLNWSETFKYGILFTKFLILDMIQ